MDMPNEQKRPAQRSDYFAETAIGAVVLVSIQFLSFPMLLGGLALIGAATLFSRLRTTSTG
jgi:hypothetical protein